VKLGSYYRNVWERVWWDWVAFLKAQIVVSLIGAIIGAVVTGWKSAEVGEAFNTRLALSAAVVAARAHAAGLRALLRDGAVATARSSRRPASVSSSGGRTSAVWPSSVNAGSSS
jgi:hypothetical protein